MKKNEFITIWEQTTEPALFIGNEEKDFFEEHGLTMIEGSFENLFNAMERGGKYVCSVNRETEKETFLFIKLFTELGGKFHLASVHGREWNLSINPKESNFIVLVSPDMIDFFDREYALRQRVGMVFNAEK